MCFKKKKASRSRGEQRCVSKLLARSCTPTSLEIEWNFPNYFFPALSTALSFSLIQIRGKHERASDFLFQNLSFHLKGETLKPECFVLMKERDTNALDSFMFLSLFHFPFLSPFVCHITRGKFLFLKSNSILTILARNQSECISRREVIFSSETTWIGCGIQWRMYFSLWSSLWVGSDAAELHSALYLDCTLHLCLRILFALDVSSGDGLKEKKAFSCSGKRNLPTF